MKIKFNILKLLVTLYCALAMQEAFGQTVWWVGNGIGPNGNNIGVTTNWSNGTTTNNLPTGGGTLQFNGSVPGPITVYSVDGINHNTGATIGGDFGASGENFEITASQTSSVTLSTTIADSTGMGLNNITLDPGAAKFTIGDTTANQLLCTMRPAGGIHTWMNNSTNPLILMPNFHISNGGGSLGHVIDFEGAGNFYITNNLRWGNTSYPATIQWDSTGTTIWAVGGANDEFNNPQGSIVIDSGTVIITSPGLLPYVAGTGSNTVAINGTATLVFDATGQSDTIQRTISGPGNVQVNNGTWTLAANNTYTGSTTVSNGVLVFNGTLSGPVSVATGAVFALGSNLFINVNKSLAPSTDYVFVSGIVTNTGAGTMTVKNLGPDLAVGDKFTLFSQPVQNGGALAITGSGANWANNLAVDGSISVNSFIPSPMLNFTQINNGLQFSWSDSRFKLQSQTNSLTGNWYDYSGGGTSPVTVPIDSTNGTTFFRLAPMP